MRLRDELAPEDSDDGLGADAVHARQLCDAVLVGRGLVHQPQRAHALTRQPLDGAPRPCTRVLYDVTINYLQEL